MPLRALGTQPPQIARHVTAEVASINKPSDSARAARRIFVVMGRTKGCALAQKRPFQHAWVHVFRFDGGRISMFKEYIDSSSVCSACRP